MKIVFVDLYGSGKAVIEALARECGHLAACYQDSASLDKKLKLVNADMLVLSISDLTAEFVEELRAALEVYSLPVVLFVNGESSKGLMQQALQAGVNTYVHQGLEASRVASIVDVTRLRYEHYQSLSNELAITKDKLKSRIVIDRAKGMLMEYQKISEKEAYRALQKTAMDKSTTVVDIANQTITVLKNLSARSAV